MNVILLFSIFGHPIQFAQFSTSSEEKLPSLYIENILENYLIYLDINLSLDLSQETKLMLN